MKSFTKRANGKVDEFGGIWEQGRFFTGIIDFITYFLFFCILLANILSACEKAG